MGEGEGTMGRRGRGHNGRARARARWEGCNGKARLGREGKGVKGGQGHEGRARARARWEGCDGPWEGDSRTGRRQQQSVASQNKGKRKGDDVSHKKSACRRRENTRDAPEFEHMADGSSTRRGNSCWPHSPVKKSHFSAFNAFSKKVHHLWEKKNRNSCDKALRVTRGTRESHCQLQR